MKLLSLPKLIRKGTPHDSALALIVTVAASVAALALVLPTNSGHAQVDEPAHGGQAYQLAQSDELGNPDPGGGGGGTSGNGSNNTDPGAQPNCYAYDSTGNNENDGEGGEGGEVCLEDLSADPAELDQGGSTDITWDINYSPSTTGDIVVRCNLTGSGIEPELIGAESSPTILDYDDFEGTTAITVACEAADDLELGQPENYDDFSDQISVTINESGGDSSNPPKADPDGTPGAGICTESDGTIIDVLDNDGDENGNDFDKTDITIPPTTLTPSDGIAAVVDKDGVDKISYTPTVSGEDSFEYSASFPDDTTDTAEVTLDVTDSACGNIEVSFASTGSDVNNLTGAKADPTYDYPGIGNLDSQKLTPERVEQAAASGQNQEQSHLSWNVPLEVATNTAVLTDDYIEPPEGYQLASDVIKIKKTETETGENFTGENTTAWLGEDYEAETSDVSDDGTTESYTGYGYQSCHFCHTGDAYTYIESFEADVTKTTKPDGSVVFSYNNEEYTGYDAVSGNSSACTQEIAENTVSCYDRWTKAKGNNDPTWDPPESYCSESGTESSCYPETDWPQSSGDEGGGSGTDTSQTCDSYTVYNPYPDCPPGAEATVYGYATCEKKCVRKASP